MIIGLYRFYFTCFSVLCQEVQEENMQTQNQPLRLGIIGCGNMFGQHTGSFDYLKDRMRISAVCDLSKERAEHAREILGADAAYTDYRLMAGAVDAVLIATPHRLHYPVGRFFLENGKHVLMEKPLCAKEQECLSLMALAKEKKLILMTAYPVRFWQEIRELKAQMESGLIGDVFQMTVYTDHWNPARDTRGTWMSCAGLGGGQFFSHGCHYVDILLWFLGKPVSGYHMGTNTGTPWMDREGTSHAVIRFANGALGYHTGTWGARGTSDLFKVELFGTKGTLSYSTTGPYPGKIVLYRNLIGELPPEERTRILWEKSDGNGKHTEGELEHFISCILEHKKPDTDAQSSLQGLRVIWKLYESERENRMADLRGLGLDDPCSTEPMCTFDCDDPVWTEGYTDAVKHE